MAPNTPSAAYRMLSIPDALELVLTETDPLPHLELPFQQAFQHTLATDVLAAEPVPAFRASIKDGYAVVSTDGPGEYTIAFESHAGSAPGQLKPGTVAYVATGAPVPDGADAVVQIEDTQFIEGSNPAQVKIFRQVESGHDIRPVGSDMHQGATVLQAGHYLGAAEIGILATVGATTVNVAAKPHIAVLSTGDEVCEPTTPIGQLEPGQIRDANRAMLLAAAQEAGASMVTDLGIARDSAALVEQALDKALDAGADILLTTGGVSMGDKDFIKPLLEQRGTIFFGKVRMKPGKPLTFAKVTRPNGRSLLVFGLPGNPVSSIVTFHLVVVPCIRKLMGWKDPSLRRITVKINFSIKMDPERPEYHRAIATWAPSTFDTTDLAGELIAESTGGQISSRLLSMRSANVLLEIPQAKGVVQAGSYVSALVIGDLAAMPVVKEAPITTLASLGL